MSEMSNYFVWEYEHCGSVWEMPAIQVKDKCDKCGREIQPSNEIVIYYWEEEIDASVGTNVIEIKNDEGKVIHKVYADTLVGADLRGVNLTKANLAGFNLKGANLSRANLYCADLESANLEGADLSHTNIVGAMLEGANLKQANLTGANLEMAYLSDANLENANLTFANLQSAFLDNVYWSGADLNEADLRKADLGDGLNGATMHDTNLEGAILCGYTLGQDSQKGE